MPPKVLIVFISLLLNLQAQTTKQNQVQLTLSSIPNCALTSGTPTGVPIILALVPNAAGVTQFGCYTISGVTVSTATNPPTITVPLPSSPVWVYGEIPTGTIDGKNVAFTLKGTCNPLAAIQLHWNGWTLFQGVDYAASATPTGCAITMTTANGVPLTPVPLDIFFADYRTQ